MKVHRIALAAACALATLAAQAQLARVQPSPSSTPGKSVNTQQAATFGLPRAAGLNSSFPAGLSAGSGPATGAAATTTTAGTPATTTATATSPTAGPVVIQNPNATVDPATVATAPAATPPVVTTPIVVGAGTPVGIGGGAAAPATAAYAATAVMGAGSSVPAARQGGSFGPGPYTAVEVASSFLNADANGDRELTRAEATRLALMPFSFEEMDRNHDGVVSRGEYDDSLR